MKFRYKKFASKVLRPVIPIAVEYNDCSVPYEVLVDSGADICIFDAEIADVLDIKLESGEQDSVAGLTGVEEILYKHKVNLKIGGWVHEVEVGFLRNIGAAGYGVLGQNGFFDIFIVQFDFLKATIELKTRK